MKMINYMPHFLSYFSRLTAPNLSEKGREYGSIKMTF